VNGNVGIVHQFSLGANFCHMINKQFFLVESFPTETLFDYRMSKKASFLSQKKWKKILYKGRE